MNPQQCLVSAAVYKVKAFSCWDQFLCMAFAQLTFRERLRDMEDCLSARSDQLYHLGFRSRVCRSTLADANQVRDWRIYAESPLALLIRSVAKFVAIFVERTVSRSFASLFR